MKTRSFHKARVLLTVVAGCSLFATLVHANKIDTLSGLTPGRLIGGRVHVAGGPDIPLAQDYVDAGGNVSFVKPNADYLSIDYIDVATGNVFETLQAADGTALDSHLTPGERFPILSSGQHLDSFFDIFVDISFDDTWGLLSLHEGDTFWLTDGENSGLPGLTGFDAYGGARLNGEFTIVGFDTVSVPDAGASLTLLCLGLTAVGLARRWAS